MGGYAGGEIKLAVPPARATPVTPHARPDTFPPCRRFTRPISLRRAFFALPTAQAAPHLLAQTLLGLTPSTRPMPRRVPPVLTGECTIEPGFCHFHLHTGVDCDFFIEKKRSATCHLIHERPKRPMSHWSRLPARWQVDVLRTIGAIAYEKRKATEINSQRAICALPEA